MKARTLRIGTAGAASLAVALPLLGFPSFTSHVHDASVIAWEQDGTKDGNSAHNHRSSHNFGGLTEDAHPYSAFACWDNKTYRPDLIGLFDSGHCFIDESVGGNVPLYHFSGSGWPAAAKDRIRQAFAAWSAITTDSGTRPMGVEFHETSSQASADIVILWVNEAGLTQGGEWKPEQRQLRFDSSINWYFPADPNEGAGIQNDQWHFYSLALHETGHVVGLAHTTGLGDLMRAPLGQPPNFPFPGNRHFMVIDDDSIQGIRDLYSQSQPPAPPPPPPQGTFCYANFQGCPPGCMESPYLMSWGATYATDYEVQWLMYGTWFSHYTGPQTSLNASTGTQHSEFFRVRGVNVSGTGPWCTITLHVQCSEHQDPW